MTKDSVNIFLKMTTEERAKIKMASNISQKTQQDFALDALLTASDKVIEKFKTKGKS